MERLPLQIGYAGSGQGFESKGWSCTVVDGRVNVGGMGLQSDLCFGAGGEGLRATGRGGPAGTQIVAARTADYKTRRDRQQRQAGSGKKTTRTRSVW